MPLNPAFLAVGKLKNEIPQVQFKTNENASYYMIHLPIAHTVLTLAGINYQQEYAAHISIYKEYNKNETQGLSVFHYTWRGFIEKDQIRTSVVLHVYFDKTGRYINCQLKNHKTGQCIQGISQLEEKSIKKHAMEDSHNLFTKILLHITTEYKNADEAVNKYLDALDKLSADIENKLVPYKKTAGLCIEAMLLKDTWTFGKTDSRVALLQDMTKLFEQKCTNQSIQVTQKIGFYPKVTEDNQKKATIQRPKKITSPVQTLNLPQELADVDKALEENQGSEIITTAKKALINLELLDKKFRILTHQKTNPLLEKAMINVLQQINAQYKAIETLFAESAKAGNLEEVKSLKPFVSSLDFYFFANLIKQGDVSICQYILQQFDECLFYLNFLAFVSKQNEEHQFDQSTTLLTFTLHHESPKLLEMLLQHGANPNFCGAVEQNHKGILCMAIGLQKIDFVKVLLENGANPNPKTGLVNTKAQSLNSNNFITKSNFKKSLQALEKTEGVIYANESSPLHYAIEVRNVDIVALLLHHGASVTKKNTLQFDALGQETCCTGYRPNKEILNLLIKHGADINAVQGQEHIQTTPLLFNCQIGDLNSVKMLIELGANPNQQIPNKALKYTDNAPQTVYIYLSALQKALVKKHFDIVDFLIKQKHKPVTFINAATSFSFYAIQEGSNINQMTLGITLSDSLMQLKERMLKPYNENTMLLGLTVITKQSEVYLQNKQYEAARNYLYTALLFCKPTNRYPIVLDLARCHQLCDEPLMADFLLTMCTEYACQKELNEKNRLCI